MRVIYDGTAKDGMAYLQQDGNNKAPYTASKYQMNFLPKGNYKLTAWVKKTTGMKNAVVSFIQAGGKSFSVNIPTSEVWRQIIINDISVT